MGGNMDAESIDLVMSALAAAAAAGAADGVKGVVNTAVGDAYRSICAHISRIKRRKFAESSDGDVDDQGLDVSEIPSILAAADEVESQELLSMARGLLANVGNAGIIVQSFDNVKGLMAVNSSPGATQVNRFD
jgi:hypothetical protein